MTLKVFTSLFALLELNKTIVGAKLDCFCAIFYTSTNMTSVMRPLVNSEQRQAGGIWDNIELSPNSLNYLFVTIF